MSYVTKDASRYKSEFKDYVINEVQKQNWNWVPNKEQHFYVDAIFYFDRLDRDCNNYFKVMLDAITDSQKIWLDDNVVCERVQRIYYDSENPRIELVITPVDYVGIFDNMSQYEKFVSRCIGCTRYSRNCSILKGAKAGKIQKDIESDRCNKYKKKKN